MKRSHRDGSAKVFTKHRLDADGGSVFATPRPEPDYSQNEQDPDQERPFEELSSEAPAPRPVLSTVDGRRVQERPQRRDAAPGGTPDAGPPDTTSDIASDGVPDAASDVAVAVVDNHVADNHAFHDVAVKNHKPDTAPRGMAPRPRARQNADAPTVVLHWGTVITLIASFATGLRISIDDPNAGWAAALAPVLPQGDVFSLHILASYALGFLTIAYITFVLAAGLRSRIVMRRTQSPTGVVWTTSQRLRAVNIMLYWCGFALLLSALVTGTINYFMPPFVPQEAVLLVHRVTAWSFLAYIVLHVLAQVAHGGVARLLKMFTPRPRYGLAALIAVIVASLGGVAVYAVERYTRPELIVRVTVPPASLSDPGLLATWDEQAPLRLTTIRGASAKGGDVNVEIVAAHDGRYLYTRFRWQDDTRSQKHLPLIKTEAGWRVKQTDFDRQDEDLFYEDQFAVMWADQAQDGGTTTTHLGGKPLEHRPGPAGGRGLHYTMNYDIVDVWHWKSVRTGSIATEQMDDTYFGPPLLESGANARYTGGYAEDPSAGGGYETNWETFDRGVVTPLYLPKTPQVLARLGDVNLDPLVSDTGEFWMKKSETIPYAAELDTLPVGSVMPSVILDGKRQGDRGEVGAESHWQDGWWTLSTRRRLDTGSTYDMPFVPGAPLFLWVAAFDHSQTRHSYHLRPVEVVFENAALPAS